MLAVYVAATAYYLLLSFCLVQSTPLIVKLTRVSMYASSRNSAQLSRPIPQRAMKFCIDRFILHVSFLFSTFV